MWLYVSSCLYSRVPACLMPLLCVPRERSFSVCVGFLLLQIGFGSNCVQTSAKACKRQKPFVSRKVGSTFFAEEAERLERRRARSLVDRRKRKEMIREKKLRHLL